MFETLETPDLPILHGTALGIFAKAFAWSACIWAGLVAVAIIVVLGRIVARIDERRKKRQHDDNRDPTDSR